MGTLGGTYTTGTISLVNGSTQVAGTGVLWVDAIEGDWIFSQGFVGIIDSVDSTFSVITLKQPWAGPTVSGASYVLMKMSWFRYDPSITQSQLKTFIGLLQNSSIIYSVSGASPDPGIGADGNWAIKVNNGTFQMWLHVAGVWVLQPAFGGNLAIRTVVAAGAVTTTAADQVVEINKTVGAATTVNLYAGPVQSNTIAIVDGKRDAATNNITVVPAAGTINGAATYVINVNAASVQFLYDGTQWIVLASSSLVALGDGLINSGSLITIDPSFIQGYLTGLQISAPGGGATLTITGGVAASNDGTAMMKLSSPYTKTLSAWAVGSGNGALDTGSIANNFWYFPYLIRRMDTGVVDLLFSLAPDTASVVGISNGTPAVISWTGHGLQANAKVVFSTTGTLPAPLTAGTPYFVSGTGGLVANSFSVSLTQGGAQINTTSAGSGVHTATSQPSLPTNYTKMRRISSFKIDASAHIIAMIQVGDYHWWKLLGLDVSNGSVPTANTAVSFALANIPPGIPIHAILSASGFATTPSRAYIYSAALTDPNTPGNPFGLMNLYDPSSTSQGATMDLEPIYVAGTQNVRVITNVNSYTVSGLWTRGWLDTRNR